MLPRRSNRVHPQGSVEKSSSLLPVVTPPTSSKDGCNVEAPAAYACLQSPSPPNNELAKSAHGHSGRGCHRFRWISNYPRLSFVLLFVLGSYLSGIYVSTKVTSWTLDVLGVHEELTAAREVYLSTSRMLNSISTCVEQSSLQYLAGAKVKFETNSKRVQELIDTNDRVISDQDHATMTCSSAFLTSLQEKVKTTASSDANTTVACFADAFYADIPETRALSSSRALVLAVRTMLTSQAMTEAHDNVNKQQKQFEDQLLDIWKSVDSVKTSIEKTMNATNTLATQQLSSFAPILSDNDDSGHKQQSASRLGRLSKKTSSALHGPLATSASMTSLEAIRKAGRTLHKALDFLSGLHEGFSDIMNALDEAWGMLEKQLNATVQQASKLQDELLYAAESTASQINRTSTSLTTSFKQAQQEVSSSFDILQRQWQSAAKKLVAEGFTPWQRLGTHLVAELTENQRQSVRPKKSIQRKYILPDRTTNSSLEQEHKRLAIASRNERLQNATTSASTPNYNNEEFSIDTAVLRASLVDVGVLVTKVIFFVDIGRLTLLFTDLAVGLITESYSDMPMLDIRGITVDTIENVCEVLLCKHSFSAVCYTFVAKSSELLRFFVNFILLFFVAIVITSLLFAWKREHITNCGSDDLRLATSSNTVVQTITRALFENSGNSSDSVVDPLNEIQKYAIIINDSIRNDYAALRLDSAAVWKNQSVALEDLENRVVITSNLVRMLQDCSEDINDGGVAIKDDTSLSSQCLMSSFINTTRPVDPSTLVKQLSTKVPFIVPSSEFESCFPRENLGREIVVIKLQHSLTCATEKAVYLSCSSWWLLIIIFIANRFTMRMLIKSAGMYWWRFLSADRLNVMAFCKEGGNILASDTLPDAIQQHLQGVKWQIAGRLVGVGFSYVFVVTVIVVIFHGI